MPLRKLSSESELSIRKRAAEKSTIAVNHNATGGADLGA